MLPPFIIEQIRQREERQRVRKEAEQPRLELPIPPNIDPTLGDPDPSRGPAKKKRSEESDDEHPDRGVVILDII